ncbi:hypothetical protein PI95_025940 [Hassallia byssoidea VB512170]|uniref:Uncharacterized protein n=1 Tax=Hassallia byssoidea VB512170 TaxID=1304833 RepID=A0A846HF07_9CYAN|nr:hypothetical protein [Hassalia byssoidea]NEU75906.1 hypothetical protein [Hassalia byssoidea VB512170]
MIQQQFEQLKNLKKGYAYKDFEVIDDKIVKKFYSRKSSNDGSNAVVEECHEFYVDGNQIVEKVVIRQCDLAIFSGKSFVLPEGCSFSNAIKQEQKYHDNAIELAFRFGIEFENSLDMCNIAAFPVTGHGTTVCRHNIIQQFDT